MSMNTDDLGRTMALMPMKDDAGVESFGAVPWAHRRMKTFELYDRYPGVVTRYAYARLPYWASSPTWGVPDPLNLLIGVRDFQPRVYGKSVKGAGTEGWVIVAPSLITPPRITGLAQPLYPAFTAAGTIRLMTIFEIDQRWWCDWWDPDIRSVFDVVIADDIVVAWWPRAHGSTAYAVSSEDYGRWVKEAQELPDPTFITRDSFMTSTPAFLELLRRMSLNQGIWTPGFSSTVMLWGPGSILRQPLEVERFDERVPDTYRKLGYFVDGTGPLFDELVFGPIDFNVWYEGEEIIAEVINGRMRDLKAACPHFGTSLFMESAKATEWLLAAFAKRVYDTSSDRGPKPTEIRKILTERQRVFRGAVPVDQRQAVNAQLSVMGALLAEEQVVDYTLHESQVRRSDSRGDTIVNKVTGKTTVLNPTPALPPTPDDWREIFLICLQGLCANPAFAGRYDKPDGFRSFNSGTAILVAQDMANKAVEVLERRAKNEGAK